MVVKGECDLAGMYVTDDYIDVLVGKDVEPRVRKLRLSELSLDYFDVSQTPKHNTFHFDRYESVAGAFEAAVRWVLKNTKNLRSVGVGCYGPFITIDRSKRGKHRDYGQLQTTSHGRLSDENVYTLVYEPLTAQSGQEIKVTVDTDVAVGAVGLVYHRSRKILHSDRKALEDKTIAFVRCSLGIGGAFLRESTTWRGRLHPEMGQINVPRWQSKLASEQEIERNWSYRLARNKHSVEGLASVPAIVARYNIPFEELVKQPEHIAWKRQAWYIAQMAWTLTCTISPDQIVLGGRMMLVSGLIDRVRRVFSNHIAGDPSFPYYAEMEDAKNYLVTSLVQDKMTNEQIPQRPGIVGALCLAAMEDQITSLTAINDAT